MRISKWIGLLCVAASWLFLVPVYVEFPAHWGVGLIILSIAMLAIGRVDPVLPAFNGRVTAVLLVGAVASAAVLRYPYNLGPVVLAVGLVLSILRRFVQAPRKWLSQLAVATCLVGGILAAQAAAMPAYFAIFTRYRDVPALASITAALARLAGVDASAVSGSVLLGIGGEVFPFTVTWEKIGILPIALFIIAIGVWHAIMARGNTRWRLRKTATIGAVIAAYALLRTAALMRAFAVTRSLDVFWKPGNILLSLAPLPLFLTLVVRERSCVLGEPLLSPPYPRKRLLMVFVMFFVAAFSAVGFKGMHDPGTVKPGRVVIDEVHSDWEKTTRVMDTEWYGNLSTYNYSDLARWLGCYYSVEANTTQSLNAELLSEVDVLILKCPTNPYSTEEILAVVEFVSNGGGLWLIGDHTNVFGMNTYLNAIANRFGLHFNNDSTHDLLTRGLSVFHRPSWLAHQVVRNVNEFQFMTSCSLQAPILADGVMIGTALGSKPGDYTDKDFFRKLPYELGDADFGAFIQSSAISWGKGRVLAFTDSTCFSNFSVFMGGNPELILGSVNYLNHMNKLAWTRIIFFGLMLLGGIGGLALGRGMSLRSVFLALYGAAMLAVPLAIISCSLWNRAHFDPAQPQVKYETIAFVGDHTSATIDPVPSYQGSRDQSYSTFFVWTQRVGLVPVQVDTPHEAVNKGSIVVIINPAESFSAEETRELVEFVGRGGKLLLMDTVRNTRSTANGLLQELGMSINLQYVPAVLQSIAPVDPQQNVEWNAILDVTQVPDRTVSDLGNEEVDLEAQPEPKPSNTAVPRLLVQGGTLLASSGDGGSSIHARRVGSGVLLVMVDSFSFSDAVMLGTGAEPDVLRSEIYALEYGLLEVLSSWEPR